MSTADDEPERGTERASGAEQEAEREAEAERLRRLEERYGPRDPELADDPPSQPAIPGQRTTASGANAGASSTGTGTGRGTGTGTGTPNIRPERKPWNLSGYIGFGLAAVAFLGSLLVGWTGAFLMAAFGLALCITGAVRVYRGRATNKAFALAGLVLALASIGLGFVWSARSNVCDPLRGDRTAWTRCYQEHAGLF